MAEDAVPLNGAAGRGTPPGGDPGLEELSGGWAVVPHGDPIQTAESGRVEDQGPLLIPGHHHLVGELVLHHQVEHHPHWRASKPPLNELLQKGEAEHLALDLASCLGG